MARWNNGQLDVNGSFATSTKTLPQDAPVNVGVYSNEARKRIFLDAIRKSQGRFTADFSVTYDFGSIVDLPHQRGQTNLPFVDFPGIKLSDGGDIRDVNAFGGGMPPGANFIGRGKPSRLSEFNRALALSIDHASPVRRI